MGFNSAFKGLSLCFCLNVKDQFTNTHTHTHMRRLTTGIHSEKCVLGEFIVVRTCTYTT